MDTYTILTQNQFGFRKIHSTYMALLSLLDDISNEINNKNHSIGIFIDISKEFDTIDHNLILKKMEYYNIRGIFLNWFHNYLSNRKQFVYRNGVNFTLLPITCGVPQGAILGLLLVIIHINNIINSSKLAKFIIFADDTNLFVKHKDLKTLTSIINSELLKI